jgi:hypothetical protein
LNEQISDPHISAHFYRHPDYRPRRLRLDLDHHYRLDGAIRLRAQHDVAPFDRGRLDHHCHISAFLAGRERD